MTVDVAAALPIDLLARIEDASINASATAQQRWLDGWMVRFCPGKAKRARCVNALAEGRLDLPRRLAACRRLYDSLQMPLIVRITPFSLPKDLDNHLAANGFAMFDPTSVMVLADFHVDRPGAASSLEVLKVAAEALAQRVGTWRGSPLAQQRAHAERLRTSPVPFTAFEAHLDGHAVACGQLAIEDDLVGLYDVYTDPAARGRGVAGQLCREMLAHAHSLGARHAYLQVEQGNRTAQSLYRRLGFVDGYGYHYRAEDPARA